MINIVGETEVEQVTQTTLAGLDHLFRNLRGAGSGAEGHGRHRCEGTNRCVDCIHIIEGVLDLAEWIDMDRVWKAIFQWDPVLLSKTLILSKLEPLAVRKPLATARWSRRGRSTAISFVPKPIRSKAVRVSE